MADLSLSSSILLWAAAGFYIFSTLGASLLNSHEMELLLSLFLHTFSNQSKSPRGDPCRPCIKYIFSTWLAYRALGPPGTGSTKPVPVSLVCETQQCLKKYSHTVSFLSHLRVSLLSSSGYLVLIENFGNDVPVLIFYFLCK